MRFKHVTRGRLLTDAEAAKYAEIRRRAEEEFKDRPIPDKPGTRLIDVLALWQFVGNLKKERERRGFSLAEVATQTGIDSTALSRLENGRNSNPTFSTLARYARALGKELRLSMVAEENPAAISPHRAKKSRPKATARARRRSA